MITADQLVAHAVGDYLLQSDWMATEKTKLSVAAAAHAFVYSLPFLFLNPSLTAWVFIVATHFVIDRWHLARYVVWAKNFIAPPRLIRTPMLLDGGVGYGNMITSLEWSNKPWSECKATGYDPDRPAWLTVWLLIISDNVLHALCNAAALRWL